MDDAEAPRPSPAPPVTISDEFVEKARALKPSPRERTPRLAESRRIKCFF